MGGLALVPCVTQIPPCYPSAEETRMLHAITTIALTEAVRDGAYRATFRSFSVEALRHIDLGSETCPMVVTLSVRHCGTPVEYGRFEVDCDQLPCLTPGLVRNGSGAAQLLTACRVT